ncbi:sugar O-acetyltransferase [Chryseobacterium chendengshani]|uniref:DapH/DapD/GlmU-related protein n=1 Tax=Chryseobacterium sp. LJ668 TaxID=2864040 RepID=UPI001C6921A4|nr:DapH/DapD/GlmU-related protein [Chryseobacterium sp. LJ668]MBW8523511.1 sugar O-acetyltransferase [Chryseobacterium sp. LJ668]QYK15794.1 sugar O-acetyltransferase [Chryseobacterium sp. LJ668]
MNKTVNNVFNDLANGETVTPNHPKNSELRTSSYDTIGLLQKMNSSHNPLEIMQILSKITGKIIDETVAVFPPLYINNGTNLQIGKNVFINFDCTFLALGGIIIEDYVLIGPKVCLLSEGHPLDPNQRHSLVPGMIRIKKNAWIGANATILPGITIGENAVVAAGAVVSKDVPDNVVVGGIPAKIIKSNI